MLVAGLNLVHASQQSSTICLLDNFITNPNIGVWLGGPFVARFAACNVTPVHQLLQHLGSPERYVGVILACRTQQTYVSPGLCQL